MVRPNANRPNANASRGLRSVSDLLMQVLRTSRLDHNANYVRRMSENIRNFVEFMSADREIIAAITMNHDDHTDLIWNQLQEIRRAFCPLSIYTFDSMYNETYRTQRDQASREQRINLANEAATFIYDRKPQLERGEINTMASCLVTQYPAFSSPDRRGGHRDMANRIQARMKYLRDNEGQLPGDEQQQNDGANNIRLLANESDEDEEEGFEEEVLIQVDEGMNLIVPANPIRGNPGRPRGRARGGRGRGRGGRGRGNRGGHNQNQPERERSPLGVNPARPLQENGHNDQQPLQNPPDNLMNALFRQFVSAAFQNMASQPLLNVVNLPNAASSNANEGLPNSVSPPLPNENSANVLNLANPPVDPNVNGVLNSNTANEPTANGSDYSKDNDKSVGEEDNTE